MTPIKNSAKGFEPGPAKTDIGYLNSDEFAEKLAGFFQPRSRARLAGLRDGLRAGYEPNSLDAVLASLDMVRDDLVGLLAILDAIAERTGDGPLEEFPGLVVDVTAVILLTEEGALVDWMFKPWQPGGSSPC